MEPVDITLVGTRWHSLELTLILPRFPFIGSFCTSPPRASVRSPELALVFCSAYYRSACSSRNAAGRKMERHACAPSSSSSCCVPAASSGSSGCGSSAVGRISTAAAA